MKKEISIIIAAYNEENNIKNCIDSILMQSYMNYEVIIIDDGSSDNTYKICKSIADKYTNIRVFRQENSGVSAARNMGIKYANGNWIMFMDADDELVVDSLKNLYDLASKEQSDLIQGKQIYQRNNDKMSIDNTKRYKSDIVQIVALNRHKYENSELRNLSVSVHGCYGKLFKLSIIRKNNISFIDGLGLGEDLLYYIKFLDYCNYVTVTDIPVYLIKDNIYSSTRRCNEKMPIFARKFTEEIFNLYLYKERRKEFYDEMCNQIYVHIEVGLIHYLMHKDNKMTFHKKCLLLKEEISNKNYQEAINHIYISYKGIYNRNKIAIMLLMKNKIRTYMISKIIIKHIQNLRKKL